MRTDGALRSPFFSQMDIQKLSELVETIEVSNEVEIAVSEANDEKLCALALQSFNVILNGPENPVAGIGALIALAMEAAERRMLREGFEKG